MKKLICGLVLIMSLFLVAPNSFATCDCNEELQECYDNILLNGNCFDPYGNISPACEYAAAACWVAWAQCMDACY